MNTFDVIIVGAGAAGLMTAALLCRSQLKIALLDGNEKAGKKLYITGKGRCNLTNLSNTSDFLDNVVRGKRFLMSALNSFPPTKTVEFFNSLGLKTVTERANRVFPLSNKASDITTTLLNQAQASTQIFLNQKVISISKNPQDYEVKTNSQTYKTKSLVLATGGKSYPLTGSDGSGYNLAKSLGHTIIKPLPSLTAIEFKNAKNLPQGLTLKNVRATLTNTALNAQFSQFGEMLFTDNGVSGPIILSLSALFAPMCSQNDWKLSIDLKPALTKNELDSRLLRDFSKNINKFIKNGLDELLPKSLIPFIIDYAAIDQDKKLNSISKNERETILDALKNLTFSIKPLNTQQQIDQSLKDAIITCGGVDLKEINPKTMESKLNENLYLIGEMLDVDAFTGGFNLQIAWSTAYSCAKAIAKGDILWT